MREYSNRLGSLTSKIKTGKVLLVLAVLICTLLLSCSESEEEDTTIWFKGNTHAHTTICGHADTPPDSVALWYLERGYHFLILSEHNYFIDPDSVDLPVQRRSDFILIPGEELTGHKHIHTTGMNTQKYVEGIPLMRPDTTISGKEQLSQLAKALRTPSKSKTEIMQQHTDDILNAGGIPILNHPNWLSGPQPHHILPVKNLHLFELYNGHPDVNNWGAEKHMSVEKKWDSLLTAGMLILGVSSDDAHYFKQWGKETSNPGRGWIMVNSESKLTPDAITSAVAKGNFYATNGVILKKLQHNSTIYKVQIDTAQTFKELSSPYVTGKIELQGKEGFKISFIGKNGKILESESQFKSVYKISNETGYVRSKISFTRKNSDGRFESFFAWTQPQFLDDRAQLLSSGHILPGHDHD